MNIRARLSSEWNHPGYLLAIASGVCLGIGFVIPVLWFSVLIGMACLLRSVEQAARVLPLVRFGLISWLMKYLFVLSWCANTYPVGWIGPMPAPIQMLLSVASGFQERSGCRLGAGYLCSWPTNYG